MTQTVTVNFKLDPAVKRDMEQACQSMGLTMSAAFTVFAKKVASERRIPFEISAPDSFYDPRNIAYLKNKMREYKEGNLQLVEHELIEG